MQKQTESLTEISDLQWISIKLSSRSTGVFGSSKELGIAKISVYSIAAAVLHPIQNEKVNNDAESGMVSSFKIFAYNVACVCVCVCVCVCGCVCVSSALRLYMGRVWNIYIYIYIYNLNFELISEVLNQ